MDLIEGMGGGCGGFGVSIAGGCGVVGGVCHCVSGAEEVGG